MEAPQTNGQHEPAPALKVEPVTQFALNGGIYPTEDGTWRVACWFSNLKNEEEAQRVSSWLSQLLQANIQQPPQAQ